jgi:hypothetical protein
VPNTTIYYATTSVSETDNTFSKKVTVGGDVDTGNYLVAVLSPGADGKYGKVGWHNLTAALNDYTLTARTQGEVLAILEDITTLSDDLIWIEYIKVVPHAYINASISKSTVPPGDSFEVYGNASLNYVEIVAISPKGGNGTGMEGLYGVSIYTVPTFIVTPDAFSDSEIAKIINVSECATATPTIGRRGGGGGGGGYGDNFYKKIKVDRGAGIGNYTILVLSPGTDGIYGDSYYSYIDSIFDLDGAGPELGAIDVSNKTQEEIVAIIWDIINTAGSDDFMWIGNIVVTQFVSVTRDLPEELVSPNEFIHVTLNQSGFFLNTGIVIERLPEGFKYVPCPAYNETTNELTIEFKNETSKNYFVRAGTAEQIENAVFSGTYKTLDKGLNEITGEVGGDTTLTLAEPTPTPTPTPVFDTGSGTYPSIFGTHNGKITPFYDINVSKIYTYSCPGTGGHTEYVAFYNATTEKEIANGSWNGYQGAGDYHYIEFDSPFVLQAKVTYNYTIRTGSYPQIIHEPGKEVTGGVINCTEFIDANGKTYTDWIPAIRLE